MDWKNGKRRLIICRSQARPRVKEKKHKEKKKQHGEKSESLKPCEERVAGGGFQGNEAISDSLC